MHPDLLLLNVIETSRHKSFCGLWYDTWCCDSYV